MALREPCSTLQISIEGHRLIKADITSKIDPIVVVSELQNGSWKEIGRTEKIKNDADPKFTTMITMKYFFERLQKLKFELSDVDGSDLQFIGSLEVSLSEIVSTKGQRLTRELVHKSSSDFVGSLSISAEQVAAGEAFDFMIQFAARHVDKKDLFGKSDPFFSLYREHSGSRTLIHKSEVCKNTLDPVWNPFMISSADLCTNDMNKTLIIEVYDWDSNSEADLIGAFETTPTELLTKKSFQMINPKKNGKKDYKNSGEFEVLTFEKHRIDTFVDFLRGGCQISFMVAIDFTGSNGPPKSATSLHYQNPAGPNEYMQAIYATGAVLEPYDADRLFPTFGFGAMLPNGQVSHDFNVNFNEADPNVYGVPGIINAYVHSLNHVELYGPTDFAPVIRKATKIAASTSPAELKYHVLLILTDGEVTDLPETVEAIITASSQPLSILIVGVGAADFGVMERLDGDDGALRSGSRKAKRDIVQFVPFRKTVNNPEKMAEQLLAEIPGQLLAYMKAHGLKPRNV